MARRKNVGSEDVDSKNNIASLPVENFIDLGIVNMNPVSVCKSYEDNGVSKCSTDERLCLENKSTYNVPVGVYKLYTDVKTPKYATERSACFDLEAYMSPQITYIYTYSRLLHHFAKSVVIIPEKENQRGLYLEPGESAFIPTGIIFDIPEGYKLLAYPRSGISTKKHLKLANCVGVIDEDYVQQTMIVIFNDSEVRQFICHGERLAQVEIAPVYQADFYISNEPPERKSNRNGGFGHTG